jgi:MoaA/NifB/PqqE/SkfB family radical SAM enzyme
MEHKREMSFDGRKLHIFAGHSCNNNCIFCPDRDPEKPRDKDALIREIRENREIANLIFAAREPTLNKDLPDLIEVAKQSDYRNIALITNGRMLSYEPFLGRLLQSGLNEIIVSLHGHDESIHDHLTQTPESFSQTKKALENIGSARKRINFRFGIATTVTDYNLKYLREILRFASGFGIDFHVLNIFEPLGKAENNLFLIPRYSLLVDALERMARQNLLSASVGR